jgi:ATP-binding cassette subfamily B protein
MWPLVRRFASYYMPYKGLFVFDFSCAVITAILELCFPLFVNHIVDKFLPSNNWPLILVSCGGLFVVYAITAGLNFVVTYWGHMLGINIETDMRSALFAHLQKLSFRFFDNHKTGDLMSRMSSDLFDIGEVAHHGPEDIFIAVMTLVGTFCVMFYIHWQMALATFAVVPFLVWLAVVVQQRISKAAKRMFEDLADYNSRVEDNISGIRVVQAFANEPYEKKLFAKNNQRFRETKILSYKIIAGNFSLSYLLTRMISLFVLLCGAWFVFQGELTNGEFIGFLLLSNILFRPIDKINAIIEIYPKGMAGFRRYLDVMDTEPEVADRPDAVEISSISGEIAYRDVTFAYDAGRPILQNINFTVRPGETVAFVGPSGAGKTTLCSLLPRFYDVSGGQITVDGRDIRDIKLASLRGQIGIVQQDVFLFYGSIRDNIAYGDLEATEEQIWEAVCRAHLEQFVLDLPEGLDTIIGERGVKLSGGQKQRLAIARMFLKNPPVLILDEATSALDTATELVIQESLAELAQGRTTLVIAHRLATIKNADRILVVTPEGIAEEGNHEELIAAGGIYSQLHYAQFGQERVES